MKQGRSEAKNALDMMEGRGKSLSHKSGNLEQCFRSMCCRWGPSIAPLSSNLRQALSATAASCSSCRRIISKTGSHHFFLGKD